MKLFEVTLKGFNTYNNPSYKVSFVVAEHPTEAYEKVRRFLNENNLGLSSERELKQITLVADSKHYSDCGILLFI